MIQKRAPAKELLGLDQALAVVAYVVLRHGDVYAPLLDRLEHEIEQERSKVSTRERAQRILSAFPRTVTEGGRRDARVG